jgi:hypothetical protein
MEDNVRLMRVESKIDEMQQTIVALAKVEVRIETIFSRQTSIESQMMKINETVQNLSNHANNRFSERVFWIIVCACVGVAVRMIQ